MKCLLLNLPEKQRDCDMETAKYFSACCMFELGRYMH